jgi:hypothetical protein
LNTLTLIAIVVEVVIKSVWPSGGDLATDTAAMTLAPPGRFSTTKVPLRRCSSFCDSMRASQSVEPPAGNGTITLTGREG